MLRTVVVIDYQNVHLTARDVFSPGEDAHEAIIHPVQYARAAIQRRNQRTRDGSEAEFVKVLVHRGLPHVDYDSAQNARCLAQRSQWERDGAEVHLRDLKYQFQRGADGRPALDIHGKKIPRGPGKEKGIDVMCALACVREALDHDPQGVRFGSLRPTAPRRIWNTNLDRAVFAASVDRNNYL